MKASFIYIVMLVFVINTNSFSQIIMGNYLSGSIESTTQHYFDDDVLGITVNDNKMASNNYLKLQYDNGNVFAGIQYEAYLPALSGYNIQLNGQKITQRYAGYRNDFVKITAGTIYDQFGNGLLLRLYEDRQLGFDNSVDGIHFEFYPIKPLKIKGIYGRQRKFMETSESTVKGIDAEIAISDFLGENFMGNIQIGGSFVNKFELFTGGSNDIPMNVNSKAIRTNMSFGTIGLNIEYAEKNSDPTSLNNYLLTKGNALLTNISYSKGRFGMNISGRKLQNMDFRTERETIGNATLLNYLPANSKQHKYNLVNIYPNSSQALAEIGGQVNIFYTLKTSNSKYGTKIQLHASAYQDLDTTYIANNKFKTNFFAPGDNMIFRDAGFEISRRLNKKAKLSTGYFLTQFNKKMIEGGNINFIVAHTGVVELIYKIYKRHSIRTEIQHLWTDQDYGNWFSGTIEYNYAPYFSIYFSDTYNYDYEQKIHYFNTGISYMKKGTKFSLSYARQRKGLLCVGGVCRVVPAYHGINIGISTNF